MYDILRSAIERNASDIHITENQLGWLRIQGNLERYEQVVHLDEIDSFIEIEIPTILSSYEELRERKRMNPIDGAFKFNDRRFRINIYLGINGINIAIRLLSDEILPLEKLFLPPEVEQFAHITSGLYLVVGTTGSGKSTTLASLIRSINEQRAENIITVEQPIEYIHKSFKSRIEQIEVGIHVDSFETATVAAMRQNPNIIFVGEMRELQTIQNAITLAETGHVVYGTLHAKSVIDSIDRIIDVFPAKQQEQVRFQIARVLKGVMHQTLIKSTIGVFPLVEQMVVDEVISSMILGRQKANAIRDHLRSNGITGNIHIVDNAVWHIKNNRLTLESVKPYLSQDDYNTVRAIVGEETKRRGFHG